MTREERLKAIQEMDAVIERAERACLSFELIQMEMMAALARTKAIHKQLIAKKAELEKQFGESSGAAEQEPIHRSTHRRNARSA
jgi:hypothetical protein